MTTDHWPLRRLVLRTPQLELRLPDAARLDELADLAAAGVHDPAVQPFVAEWTDAPPAEQARGVLQRHWAAWAAWRPDDWHLHLVAVAGGRVIGTQGIRARQFADLREVSTGSWIGREHQGRGYGTQMRAAVLELAFAGLGARYALSAAFADNHASHGVSRKLGYADDGIDRLVVRGRPVVNRRLRLDRDTWQSKRRLPVETAGLEPCLPMFGV